MFISKIITNQIHGDHYYIAVQSKRGLRYVWKRVPLFPGPDVHVGPADVPEAVRERAYDLFERDRMRGAP